MTAEPNMKLAGGVGGAREILVSEWKPYQKNTLRGFLSLTLPSGLVIHNCTLHQKAAARWIGLPARQYTKDDGSTSFTPVIEFSSNTARARFQAAALEAMDRYMESGV
jgi:DNA-binding cell septation regulator SpoVG